MSNIKLYIFIIILVSLSLLLYLRLKNILILITSLAIVTFVSILSINQRDPEKYNEYESVTDSSGNIDVYSDSKIPFTNHNHNGESLKYNTNRYVRNNRKRYIN